MKIYTHLFNRTASRGRPALAHTPPSPSLCICISIYLAISIYLSI